MASVALRGLDAGVQALKQVRDAAGRFQTPMLRVGSDLIYAWGIETGRTRGGRVARKAGPAHYLQGALQRVEPQLRAKYARALEEGPAAVDRATEQAGRDLVAAARSIVPVRSGRLKGSIRSVPGGR